MSRPARRAATVSRGETLTILVPAYNEEDSIEVTLDLVQEVVPTLPVRVEVVMINDGSTDRTHERMLAIAGRHGNCRVVDNPQNMGLGRSVLRAINSLDDDSWACVIPGDNEFFFSSIHNYLGVRDQFDVILGYCNNLVVRSFSRRVASAAYSHVVNYVYGYTYRYHNGMKMFRAGALKGIDVEARGYAYFAELLAKALLRTPELRVGEVPFLARGRATGVSKAFRPSAVGRAVLEVFRGYRSVERYRMEMIRQHAARGLPR